MREAMPRAHVCGRSRGRRARARFGAGAPARDGRHGEPTLALFASRHILCLRVGAADAAAPSRQPPYCAERPGVYSFIRPSVMAHNQRHTGATAPETAVRLKLAARVARAREDGLFVPCRREVWPLRRWQCAEAA